MGSNGNTPKLRVLLSGPAADRLAPALDHAPGISMLGLREADDSSPTDVAIHVVRSSSDRMSPRRFVASAGSRSRR
jgi:hypothetical protein